MACLAGQEQGNYGQPVILKFWENGAWDPRWLQKRWPGSPGAAGIEGHNSLSKLGMAGAKATTQGDRLHWRGPVGVRSYLRARRAGIMFQELHPDGTTPVHPPAGNARRMPGPYHTGWSRGGLQFRNGGKGGSGYQTKYCLVPEGGEPLPSQGPAEKGAPGE